MISFQQARSIILPEAHSFGEETISLENALGRVLAEDIFAPRDFPPFNRSMMDGIAVKYEDLESEIDIFKCVETIFAGQESKIAVQSGECYKIMTGAAVPLSTDVVIRIEDVSAVADSFKILSKDFKSYQNIAKQGQDLKRNELALRKGTLVNASTIGFLASLGKAKLKVEKLPLVNAITTGDEVKALNQEISSVHIYNSNQYVIKSLLQQHQISVQNFIHLNDVIDDLTNTISAYLETDILIITGGVSEGDADYIPDILESLGVQKLFYKVAIKPGKPIWCGQLENKTIVFALPGNPFSCLVTFKLFIEFYLKTCFGIQPLEMEQLPLNFDRSKKSYLDEFFPVDLKAGQLNKIDINGSGDVRLGYAANALAMQLSETNEIKKGTLVPYLLL